MTKKGGLDLTALKFDLQNRQTFASWVLIHDRVSAGEMPPKKKARPEPADLAAFVKALSTSLVAAESASSGSDGRATQRRMNRYEYEDTLQDLLSLPYLEVKAFLPEDSEAYGFNKVGDALDVSHVQMARYLGAAEFALREADGAAGDATGEKRPPAITPGIRAIFRPTSMKLAGHRAQPRDVSRLVELG